MTSKKRIVDQAKAIFKELNSLDQESLVETLNELRQELKSYSPFAHEPVDCVLWIKAEEVMANDYNPNNVASPEMKLLEISIREDGFTQPIVTWKNKHSFEVVDGFHRNIVSKKSEILRSRLKGYLPVVVVNQDRENRSDRIAATIRHNRARGKHVIDVMSEIVIELKERNHSNQWIAEKLGMDEDEVLRLTQISGLASMFADSDFSRAWEAQTDPLDLEAFTLNKKGSKR